MEICRSSKASKTLLLVNTMNISPEIRKIYQYLSVYWDTCSSIYMGYGSHEKGKVTIVSPEGS